MLENVYVVIVYLRICVFCNSVYLNLCVLSHPCVLSTSLPGFLYTSRRETLWIFKKLWECWLLSESTVNILEFYWSVCICTCHQLKNTRRRPPSLFVFFVLSYGHKYAYVNSNNSNFIFLLLRTYHKFIHS